MSLKKVLKTFFLFGLALSISMLAACGGNTEESVSTAGAGVPAQVTTTTTAPATAAATTERSTEVMENDLYRYKYDPETDGIEIVKYIGGEREVVIPDEIDSTPVTIIGDKAFYKNKEIRSITISDSVIKIGESAFAYCDQPEILSLGANVETISDEAFTGCSAKETLIFPEALKTIGDSAFKECPLYGGIVFGSQIEKIGEKAFYGALVPSKNTPMEEYWETVHLIIPSTTKSVGEKAFSSCFISDVVFEEGVEEIGWNCFEYTLIAKSVALPSSLKYTASSGDLFHGATGETHDYITEKFTVTYNGVTYDSGYDSENTLNDLKAELSKLN